MKHYNLRNEAQVNGGFTDLFILGTNRAAGNTTDFTAAALTQAYNLMPLSKGDVIIYPIAQAWLKRSFTDQASGAAPVSMTSLKLDVGTTTAGSTAIIAGAANELIQHVSPVPDSNLYPITPPSAAINPTRILVSGTQFVTATLTAVGGNISTVTFGEVWIYVAIARSADWMRDRDA